MTQHWGAPTAPSISSDPAAGNARSKHLPTAHTGKRPLRAQAGGAAGVLSGVKGPAEYGGARRSGEPCVCPAAVPLNGVHGAATAAARAGQWRRSCWEAESEADGVRR